MYFKGLFKKRLSIKKVRDYLLNIVELTDLY